MLKSNGLHCPKIRLKKFGFSLTTTSANIAKKLPPQRCFKPLLIPIFNFSHKRPTFAFTPESGYTLAFRRRIAHNGSHGETGAFPPPATAGLCVASEIAPITTFATLDSATLLYTYISRFTVNPQHQQREKSGETAAINFIPNRFSSQFSTSPTNGPRSLSQAKAGTHSTLREKSHTTAHAETGGLPFCEHRAAFYCQRDRSKQNDQKKRMHA